MEALRPKLVKHLESMMATVVRVEADSVSGQIAHSSAGRIADAVLSITRGHDEDYARTLPLAAAFQRLPVEISVSEAKAPFADGYLTDESTAMLAAAAEREFAARQRDADPWPGDASGDPEVSAMARIVRLMEANPLDGHAVIRALYPLDGPALPRVLRWFLARFPAPDDPPF